MESKITKKTKEIINTLLDEIVQTNLEYTSESISLQTKRDEIDSSISIALFRLNKMNETLVKEVIQNLKTEGHSLKTITHTKELFNERL